MKRGEEALLSYRVELLEKYRSGLRLRRKWESDVDPVVLHWEAGREIEKVNKRLEALRALRSDA